MRLCALLKPGWAIAAQWIESRDTDRNLSQQMKLDQHARISVAPMMYWTDWHCRTFHRRLTRRALLYTEMVTAAAIVHGDRDRLLKHGPDEHPVALQIGGSDPDQLAAAVRAALPYGYDEFNLNVGCPSDRVQSGCFGAALMRRPELVADCAASMVSAAGSIPVTVKCRIGVDDQIPQEILPRFLETVARAGVKRFAIHARMAWLEGLSPKENREIPPLDHELVLAMKRAFPELHITINGGIADLEAAELFLGAGIDGVMIGRAAYQNPALLGAVDRRIFGETGPDRTAENAVHEMLPYIEMQLSKGVRLHQITRHLLGAFQGRRGARAWRRMLSEHATRPGAGLEVVDDALRCLEPELETI